MDRLEALKNLLAQDPANSFARYGLAMEYVKTGALEEAVAEFRRLAEQDRDYAYAYFHCGQALEKLERLDEARETYRQGLEAAARRGDAHARSEIQAALDLLG